MASTTRFDDQDIFSEFDDPARREIIRRILSRLPNLDPVPRARFFALWFADLGVLEKLGESRDHHVLLMLIFKDPGSVDVPAIWANIKHLPHSECDSKIPGTADAKHLKPRARATSLLPATTDSPQSLRRSIASTLGRRKRDIDVSKAALSRDGERCVLTKRKQPSLHVTHIVPFKFHRSQRSEDWAWLKFFWGDERTQKWKRAILGRSNEMNTEQVFNLLTLDAQSHAYWDLGLCAFRPVRVNQEKTSMDVAFHWLPPPNTELHRQDPMPIISEHPYPDHKKGYGKGPGTLRLVHCETELPLFSGYIFTLTTDDPVEKPLPSFELLQLQWHLRRIAAMQGADENEDSVMESEGDIDAIQSPSVSPNREERVSRRPLSPPPKQDRAGYWSENVSPHWSLSRLSWPPKTLSRSPSPSETLSRSSSSSKTLSPPLSTSKIQDWAFVDETSRELLPE